MRAREICEKLNEKFGTNLSNQSIQCYIKNGLAGQSPLKNGSPGDIPSFIYNTICSAFESHLKSINTMGDFVTM